MAFYLAMDAGGTKTDYLLADETRDLVRVRTGTIKRLRVDAETAAANLDTALAELTARSGVRMEAVARTCVGTAGQSVPLVRDWLRRSIGERVAGELILLGDVEIALDAAFRGGPGVLVMAGTGSNVAGRGADGGLVTAGGWGPALADQGSGHRIGVEGLRAAFLARDEHRPSALLDAVLQFWGLASVELLVEYANADPGPDLSRLTEVVLRCSNEGDAVARSVLERQGKELGWLVRLVIRRLLAAARAQGAGDGGALPEVAFTGSIMEKVPPVREALIAEVRGEFPGIRMMEGVFDPIAGAMWRARGGGRA